MPTKQERFIELAKMMLHHANDPDAAMDCVLSTPESCVPDLESLRYFTHDFLAFFGGRVEARMALPRATAKYIHRWKMAWMTRKIA